MQTVAVGSLASCVTLTAGYAGVVDLSGNVWEWEDSCSGTGQAVACRIRGGAFFRSDLSCSHDDGNIRVLISNYIGFRCCTP